MLMAIDIGNTQTVLGVFEGENLRERWRVRTEANRTADEAGAVCATLFGLAGTMLDRIEALIVSSVVPGLSRCRRTWRRSCFGQSSTR